MSKTEQSIIALVGYLGGFGSILAGMKALHVQPGWNLVVLGVFIIAWTTFWILITPARAEGAPR